MNNCYDLVLIVNELFGNSYLTVKEKEKGGSKGGGITWREAHKR